MKIVVLYGGKSAEHDVSILTARAIINHIDYSQHQVQPVYINREGEWLAGPICQQALADEWSLYLTDGNQPMFNNQPDMSFGQAVTPSQVLASDSLVFPALHGPNGEDGTIQGLFESLNVPYVGSGVLASAAGMDKLISKYLFDQAGLPQVAYVGLNHYQWHQDQAAIIKEIEGNLTYPVFVKPANLGSSVGISCAQDQEELVTSVDLAFKYDRRVVVEQGVEARELEVAVMGNYQVASSVVGELVKDQGFYDYEEKYVNNKVEMAIPAPIPADLADQLQAYAKTAYQVLDCSGLTRVDFFLTADDHIYINEVNTMPGFTQFSMYPSLWRASGKDFDQLVAELIDLGLERYRERQALADH
ncbi:D-alanine--D-alanine ligase [Aerococcus urinaehominis]|uniref:D-alanine--D-alanine ligase n=1 Tax=Aerococcus urinaehominis TaxID=128944 RepID=A0A0X8FKX6_9LACT|nr:D-alanine--D-alanine ligase [Aerococcus urinaehominis]AMB99200.1 D-alanine--D-alanine ligase [Aerococcus urinaehominis]SDM32586.1 D-alanine-D-alanine ligase [Aerococcus urinaehominis]